MWGTPRASRWTVTGAERPGMATEKTIELRERVAHGVARPDAGAAEGCDEQNEDGDEGDGEVARQTGWAGGLRPRRSLGAGLGW